MLKKQYSKDKPVCTVTFTFPKEILTNVQTVKVLGDFNGWDWNQATTFQLSGNEYKAVAELPAGNTFAFRYLADQTVWITDAGADAYAASPFGENNAIIVIDPFTSPTTTKKVEVKTTKAPKTAKPTVKEEKPAKPAKTVAAPAKNKAVKATTVKDDLAKIEGIGPKIAELLNAKAILTFDDLAKAKATTLKEILEAAGSRYRMHDPATWPQQAKLAAKGDWAKLTKLQDELKGGKKA